MKPIPIRTRILTALRGTYGGRMTRETLLLKTFPADLYPNAQRYRAHGGPPGCAMTLRKALNGMERDGLVALSRSRSRSDDEIVALTAKGTAAAVGETSP